MRALALASLVLFFVFVCSPWLLLAGRTACERGAERGAETACVLRAAGSSAPNAAAQFVRERQPLAPMRVSIASITPIIAMTILPPSQLWVIQGAYGLLAAAAFMGSARLVAFCKQGSILQRIGTWLLLLLHPEAIDQPDLGQQQNAWLMSYQGDTRLFAELSVMWLMVALTALAVSLLLPWRPWLVLRAGTALQAGWPLALSIGFYARGVTAYPPFGTSFAGAMLAWLSPIVVHAAATPARRRAVEAALQRACSTAPRSGPEKHGGPSWLQRQLQQPAVKTALMALVAYAFAELVVVPWELHLGLPVWPLVL